MHAYAGAANGGDILFFEVCRDLEISATALLAAPREVLVPLAVARPDHDWISRFDAILDDFPSRLLADELGPPPGFPASDRNLGTAENCSTSPGNVAPAGF